MTAAARALYVAQPVVSRSLRALEGELGVLLLKRVGRNVVLTPAGMSILHRARNVLAELGRLEELARGHSHRQAPLSLATTPTLERFFTRRLAPELLGEPSVHVSVIRASGRGEVAAAVRTGDAELGLTDLPVPPGLDTITLGAYEVVLVSPAGTRLPPEITLQDLDGLPLILSTAGSERRAEYEMAIHQLGITPVVALETDERSSWTTAVLMGVGSFLWYRSSAHELTLEGAELRSFKPPLTRAIGIVHRPGAALSEGAARLIDIARAADLDPDG